MSDKLPVGEYMEPNQATREGWNTYIDNGGYCDDDIYMLLDEIERLQAELNTIRHIAEGNRDRGDDFKAIATELKAKLTRIEGLAKPLQGTPKVPCSNMPATDYILHVRELLKEILGEGE